MFQGRGKKVAKLLTGFVPVSLRRNIAVRRLLLRTHRPVRMGGLRETRPITKYGWERGRPIDRYYIEEFLHRNRADIRGRVLEVRDSSYTQRFGSGVVGSEILDVDANNGNATIVADLAVAEGLPNEAFDCFILTQTLQYIADIDAAIANAHRLLRPGGVLLVTVPAIGRIEPHPQDYWRLTPASCARLFGKHFPAGKLSIESHGNVLSALAFLKGLACEDLRKSELDYADAAFPVILCLRAWK
jgi:SAM-dependent methyltransferase